MKSELINKILEEESVIDGEWFERKRELETLSISDLHRQARVLGVK